MIHSKPITILKWFIICFPLSNILFIINCVLPFFVGQAFCIGFFTHAPQPFTMSDWISLISPSNRRRHSGTIQDSHDFGENSEAFPMTDLATYQTVGQEVAQDQGSDQVQNQEGDQQRRGQGVKEGLHPRLWSGDFTSVVILCLFSGSAVVVICIPFLPQRHSNKSFDEDVYLIRDIFLIVLIAISIASAANMVRKRDIFHELGLALWPNRCKHCSRVLEQLRRHQEAICEGDSSFLDTDSSQSNSEHHLPMDTIKSNLYVTYIFAALATCFLALQSGTKIVCFLDDSVGKPSGHVVLKSILGICLDCCAFCALYFINFRFIPFFHDAHFVAIPKLLRSIILIMGVAFWLAISNLAKPFNIMMDGQKTSIYPCSFNGTGTEFMMGLRSIAEPFYVELPIMVVWIMKETWSRFLPRHTKSIIEQVNKSYTGSSLRQQLSVSSLCTALKSILKTFNEKRASSNKKCRKSLTNNGRTTGTVRYGSMTSNSRSERTSNESSGDKDHGDTSPQRSMGCSSKNKQSNRQLVKRLEICAAVLAVVCTIYFGISKLLLAEYSGHENPEDALRGRYVQWFARIALFTPGILAILRHRITTRREDGAYDIRMDTQSLDGSYTGNEKLLVLTCTGACLYEISCFIASLGNIFQVSEISHTLLVLSAVSVLSSVFGTIRKSLETIFLLRVHRQSLKRNEVGWTLFCLLYMGMANATQWLWDSLIHDVHSPVAWPVLTTFFAGRVGAAIGMLLVPFTHLYELHTAILAYEIFKSIRAQDTVG